MSARPRMMNIMQLSAAICMNADEIWGMVKSGELPRPGKGGKWRWASVDFALTRGQDNRSSVYFIEALDFIKIGYSTDLPERLETISQNLPVEPILLHSMIGGVDLETDLHRRFAHLRVRGEWFRRDAELLDFIERLRRTEGKPQ